MCMRIFSIVLLSTLVVSCLGLGVGMSLHRVLTGSDVIPMTESTGDVSHTCCMTASDMSDPLDYHVSIPYTLAQKIAFLPMLFVFSIVLPALRKCGVDKNCLLRRSAYRSLWDRTWQFYALYIVRLFSQGILHPRSW